MALKVFRPGTAVPTRRQKIRMDSDLTMSQKVLLVLYRLSVDGKKKVRYEDIVVQAFKDYPADFHLKGYPEFPESGDAVHKPLYEYRKRGMVSASNKMFSLTPHGLAEAQRLQAVEKGKPGLSEPRHRLERDAQIEIERIKQLEGFKLFLAQKHDEIIDSDLFEYLGVSVRSTKNDFLGRLETMKSAIEAASSSGLKDPILVAARQFHDFLMNRFSTEIDIKAGRQTPAEKGRIA
ncbi:MAG: hypothetical protein LAO04_18225 [Acidobacteriia bacterium]|nr:hypothetical protein [Terriglobia bacterium]